METLISLFLLSLCFEVKSNENQKENYYNSSGAIDPNVSLFKQQSVKIFSSGTPFLLKRLENNLKVTYESSA